MQPELKDLLRELENFGNVNDLSASQREQKMLNITPDTGPFLSILIQNCRARRVLEVGTSNGYSTLWIADALSRTDGVVVTIEIQDHKVAKAKENFARSGLAQRIQQVQGDAGGYLKNAGRNSFDLIFLDSDRNQYVDWFSDLMDLLKPGGLLVVDNATSHSHELHELNALIEKSQYLSSLVPIGNGELLVLKPL
jgi:predicted O-methyltransferase YrrM